MKKIVTVMVLFLLINKVNGQITKGNWLVGGAASLYSYNEEYTTQTFNQTAKYTSIDILASTGYFIIDKFAIGLRPGFSSYKGEVVRASVGSGGKTNSYKLTIGPFARYYFLNTTKPFNMLVDASYQIGVNKYLGSLNEKGKYNILSVMGGTEIFFNQTAGLEILLGYVKKVTSIENSPSAFNNIKNGLQMSIGFTIHLEKK